MKVGKPKSKRVPVRLRHKIQKASAAKQRKGRKEAKTNPQWRSRLKKDPGIPNLFPYKAKILAEIEESKRRKEEEQMQKREVAKARREGRAVEAQASSTGQTIPEEDLLDEDDEDDGGVSVDSDGDEAMVDDGKNPMAALFASAQAMAQTYDAADVDGDDSDEVDEEDENDGPATRPAKDTKNTTKALPKRALDDPIKAVTLLMTQMQATPDGVQTLLDYYQIPPLVNTGSDIATRTLVEVARKRGRLGRGGVPNLHAAALIILSDLHEQRLRLPSIQKATKKTAKGEVSIVKTMAAPFRLEGLWGDSVAEAAAQSEMAVDA